LFTDLPANVAGSFIMGLLSPGDLLALIYPSTASSAKGIALPLLHQDSPLQKHAALLLGLRTGYCGSLTTFASWMVQMVEMMIGGEPAPVIGSEWVAALWGVGIGTAVSLAALVLGQHVALIAWYAWNAPSPSVQDDTAKAAAVEAAEGLAASKEGEAGQDQDGAAGAGVMADALSTASQAAAIRAVSLAAAGSPNSKQEAAANGQQQVAITVAAPAANTACGRTLLVWAADGAALTILLVLTGVSLGFAVHDTREKITTFGHRPRSFQWFSILLGPAGCLLRWKLSTLNGKVKGSWSWFPAGTFAANMGACVLDFVMTSLLLRVTRLTSLQTAILTGIVVGIGGCLSTVSTWVVEIQKLSVTMPHNLRGYTYMGVSLVTAIILGIIIYGTSVWTM